MYYRPEKGLLYIFLLAALIQSFSPSLYAQDDQQQQAQQVIQIASPHPPAKIAQRYEIDAKSAGVNLDGNDALPRSREFIRIDSTYYLGWLYEGAYKYNHSADYVGFKNASIPLERAMRLIERDYRKQLSTRTSSVIEYFPAYKIHLDYTRAAYYLMTCYSNMEQPDKVFALLRRVAAWRLQRDFFMDAYNYMAWTVHRNRFYTSAKYGFLKNSINENEKLAQRYLDSGMRKIQRNRALNDPIFGRGWELPDKLSVYHYKSILYSYALNIDSAAYYYEQMRQGRNLPHNNYATFRSICGDFRIAEKEYKEASRQDAGDKRLQEWAYYTSILDIYKGNPKAGIELSKGMIKAAGSTPGFGWYNIALARCTYYDGQIAEAKRYIEKAAGFKELHIGTTLGQSHYDFSIQLNKLMNKQAEWEMQKFEHRNWWYHPQVLGHMARLLSEQYMQQFLIINQFAQNPERDRVIYKLFSTESTVTWDEVWYLIRDFSTQYFLDRFEKEAQTDNRKNIRKYFEYFVARLYMKQGKYETATRILDNILSQPQTDIDYEKLFVARVFQAEAECAAERKDKDAANEWIYRMYMLYPQLIPLTGIPMNMVLHVSGTVDQDAIDRLKACNINWITNSAIPAPHVYITFTIKGDKKSVSYYVLDKTGKELVPRQSIIYSKPEDAGITLAYRIFNIAGMEAPKEKE